MLFIRRGICLLCGLWAYSSNFINLDPSIIKKFKLIKVKPSSIRAKWMSDTIGTDRWATSQYPLEVCPISLMSKKYTMKKTQNLNCRKEGSLYMYFSSFLQINTNKIIFANLKFKAKPMHNINNQLHNAHAQAHSPYFYFTMQ